MMYGKTVSGMPAYFAENVKLLAGEEVKLVDANEEQIAQHIHIVAKTKSGKRLTFCVLCFEAQDFSLTFERKASGRAKTFWKGFLSSVRADYIVGMDESGVFQPYTMFIAPRPKLLEILECETIYLHRNHIGTFFHFFIHMQLDTETGLLPI